MPWCCASDTGEQEFRGLTPEELKACQEGCRPGGCRVADLDRQLLQQLYKKGLIHLHVPIRPDDHVSIPPLEVHAARPASPELVCCCEAWYNTTKSTHFPAPAAPRSHLLFTLGVP